MIREAMVGDIPRLVAMGERFLTETVYRERDVRINAAAMTSTVTFLITNDIGTVLVDEAAGAIVGMIGLLGYVNPITGDLSVTELFWWVEPAQRGRSGTGVRLLKRGEQWARSVGAQQIHMIAPIAAVGRLYERLGYHYLEATYQKAVG